MIGPIIRPFLYRWAKGYTERREPDLVVGEQGSPYMRRWHILRTRWCSVYIHHFMADDPGRELHDHPYYSVSLLLDGYLDEVLPGTDVYGRPIRRELYPGDLRFRDAKTPHRIEVRSYDAMTLFITGPRIREWGFHCPKGWRHWKDYVDPKNPGVVGKGCGD